MKGPPIVKKILQAVVLTLAFTGTAVPGVASADKYPYPDLSRYAKLDFEGFQIDGKPGVWFSSPAGLDCGIWDDGSFGCTGAIPDAPAGTNQVGWFTGDQQPHFDNTDQPRFTAGQAQRVLPDGNYIAYKGAKCATVGPGVFCEQSNQYYAKFLVSPGASFLGNGN